MDFELKENVLFIRLRGELDHHTSQELRQEVEEMMETKPVQNMVLNLEALQFMDSSGVGVILGRYKQIQKVQGEMIVVSVPEDVQRLFDMSGLYKIVRTADSENDALKTLGVA